MSNYKKPVCRGSRFLGNHCGRCERCKETEYLSESPSDRIKDLEQQLYQSNKERAELERKLAEANQTIEALNNDDTEIFNVEMAKRMMEYKGKLAIALDCLGFYANKDNWEQFTESYSEYAEDHMICATDCIIESDTEIFKHQSFASKEYQVGGKRAREALTKINQK